MQRQIPIEIQISWAIALLAAGFIMCMQRALSSKMQRPISALPHIIQGHNTHIYSRVTSHKVEGKVAEEKHFPIESKKPHRSSTMQCIYESKGKPGDISANIY